MSANVWPFCVDVGRDSLQLFTQTAVYVLKSLFVLININNRGGKLNLFFNIFAALKLQNKVTL